jgi:hypothetical protein
MSKEKLPVTPAIRVLRNCQVAYTPHLYNITLPSLKTLSF